MPESMRRTFSCAGYSHERRLHDMSMFDDFKGFLKMNGGDIFSRAIKDFDGVFNHRDGPANIVL